MSNNVFKRIGRALPGAVNGFMQGANMRSEWEKRSADADYNRQMALLAKQKSDEAMIDSLIKENEGGFQRDANGMPQVNPDFWDPNSDTYKRTAQAMAFKRMGAAGGKSQYEDLSPLAGTPEVQGLGLNADQLRQLPMEGTLADVVKQRLANQQKRPLNAATLFQMAGRPLPQGMDPNLLIDSSYANVIPKPAPIPQGMRAADFFAAQGRELPQGLAPDTIIPNGAGGNFKPPMQADPSQIRAYEARFGAGTSRGLTPAQIMSGLATIGGQDRQDARFKQTEDRQVKAEARRQKEHDEDQAFQRDKATSKPREDVTARIAALERMAGYADKAAAINPSWLDYQKTRAKVVTNSMTGGRLAQLTPEETERMAFYDSLSQDAIRELFANGGKNLTENEEKLSRTLAIQPGDTLPRIQSKIQAIQNYATSKINSELDEIERLNPGSSGDLRGRFQGADQALSTAGKKVKTAAAARAKPATQAPSLSQSLGDFVASKIRGNPSDQRASTVASGKVVQSADTQVVAKGSVSDQRANEATALRDARQTLEQFRGRIQQEMAQKGTPLQSMSTRMDAFKQKLLNQLSQDLGRPVRESEIESGNSRGNYGR